MTSSSGETKPRPQKVEHSKAKAAELFTHDRVRLGTRTYRSFRHQRAARVAVLASGARHRLEGCGRSSQVRARINRGGSWLLPSVAGKKRARASFGFLRNSSTMATRCTQGMVQ